MTNAKHLLARSLLALALATAGLAQAGTIYHVEVSSNGHTGPGSLELSFLGLDNAAPATATVSGFQGAFGTDGDQWGSVTGTFPGPLVFSNDAPNDFWRAVTLGDKFSFDVDLDLPTAAGAGTTLAVYLTDDAGYLGADGGPVARFELATGMSPALSVDAAFASIAPAAAVPEPSGWALAGIGFLMLGAVRRFSRRASELLN